MDQTPLPKWGDSAVEGMGFHNANLPATTLRLAEGGSWKKQDTVILLPAARMVPTKAALSWMHMLTPPNQSAPKIDIVGMLGLEVGDAYSTAIDWILQQPGLNTHRFLLTVEHDNVVPGEGLVTLMKHMEAHPEFACISGLYFTKGHGGVAQIWGDPKDPVLNFRPQLPDLNGGLVECNGTGMGFALWKLDLFKDPRLRKPWFKTLCGADGVGTQDLYAWTDFRKNGYRCAVACDVKVGHYDVTTNTNW